MAKTPNVGQWRDKIDVIRKFSSDTPTAFGNNDEWRKVHAQEPAYKEVLAPSRTASEEVITETVVGITYLNFTVRCHGKTAAISTDDRLIETRTGIYYELVAIKDDNASRFRTFLCKKAENQNYLRDQT